MGVSRLCAAEAVCAARFRRLPGTGLPAGQHHDLRRVRIRERVFATSRASPLLANGWGLFDVAGNVFEWCNDMYTPLGYPTGPSIDPITLPGTPSDLTLNPAEQRRILRGGDYLGAAHIAKSNSRMNFFDGTFGANVGIRLARTLEGTR
jgi:formylglycine-generating enzyme required for sulfatase activity